MSTYIFKDKAEMAMFFMDRANAAAGQAGRATTKKEQATWRSAAATWEQAADILRRTYWEDEARADPNGVPSEVLAALAAKSLPR